MVNQIMFPHLKYPKLVCYSDIAIFISVVSLISMFHAALGISNDLFLVCFLYRSVIVPFDTFVIMA